MASSPLSPLSPLSRLDRPAEVTAAAVTVRSLWRRLWPDARPYRWWMALAALVLCLLPAVEAVEIWLFQRVVDDILVPADLGALPTVAALYVALALASAGLSYADTYLAAWIGQHVTHAVRCRLFDHLLRLAPDRVARRQRGDVLSRLSGDVAEVEHLLIGSAGEAVAAVARLVLFAVALFLIDPLLAALSLVLAPLLGAVAGSLTRRIRRAAREHRHRTGSLTAVAERALATLALVQSSCEERATSSRFAAEGTARMAAGLAGARYRALLTPIAGLLELGGLLLVVGLGTWALAGDRVTLGQLLTFLTFLSQLHRPVRELTDLSGTVMAAAAGAERVVELLDEVPAVTDRPGAMALDAGAATVELDGVSFRYPGEERDALRDVTLTVAAGERVALVGPSGAGKSTVAKLVVRFHDPDAGTVRIGGHDLRGVTLGSLRRHVTLLAQDGPLPGATVEEAIAFGTPGARVEDVATAARAAGADHFVAPLPDGYGTPMGEGGTTFSGGQAQRIALARALLRPSPVVVLDEPTAALDPTAAAAVLDALDRLGPDRTVLVVSHQLLAARWADRVVVLDGGRVVEDGRHDELVAAGGVYAALWRRSGVAA